MKSCSFSPSFHFKKVLWSSPLECLIYGFRQRGAFFHAKSGCVLYADATYTRVYTVVIINYIYYFNNILVFNFDEITIIHFKYVYECKTVYKIT